MLFELLPVAREEEDIHLNEKKNGKTDKCSEGFYLCYWDPIIFLSLNVKYSPAESKSLFTRSRVGMFLVGDICWRKKRGSNVSGASVSAKETVIFLIIRKKELFFSAATYRF